MALSKINVNRLFYIELSLGKKTFHHKHGLDKTFGQLCGISNSLHFENVNSQIWDHRFNIPLQFFFHDMPDITREGCECIRCMLEKTDFSNADCLIMVVNSHQLDDNTVLFPDGKEMNMYHFVQTLNDCTSLCGKPKIIMTRRISEHKDGHIVYCCSYCARELRHNTTDGYCSCGKWVCSDCLNCHMLSETRKEHELLALNKATSNTPRLQWQCLEYGVPDDFLLMKVKYSGNQIEPAFAHIVQEHFGQSMSIFDIVKGLTKKDIGITIRHGLSKNVEF